MDNMMVLMMIGTFIFTFGIVMGNLCKRAWGYLISGLGMLVFGYNGCLAQRAGENGWEPWTIMALGVAGLILSIALYIKNK